jgi:aerobic carbon-monoxide dehydrogenase small subunit
MKPPALKQVTMTINGRPITDSVEPRLSLADFLREHLQLAGAHLGCETGVCGACTVLIDDVPVRSCLIFTVSLSGSEVRTIEGFDDDDVMSALRAAFSQDHALQCGFCTPGMLITARDTVLRLPDAEEHQIRQELSGNLCRCTGYMGIVAAIQRVLQERKAKPAPNEA